MESGQESQKPTKGQNAEAGGICPGQGRGGVPTWKEHPTGPEANSLDKGELTEHCGVLPLMATNTGTTEYVRRWRLWSDTESFLLLCGWLTCNLQTDSL